MPKITINGKACEFTPGQMIIQVANAQGVDIPQYCYHDGLSIVASCRICLAEVWQPNPRNNNALEPIPKLVPTCQTACSDGMVVYTDSPKAMQNQKAVMEYLLINHPLDCPVCDQSGECFLQDYSYQYGRGTSRFEETKVKNPKKDVGPNVFLYADRCIMCTRCVRFTREVAGTAELLVQGRGNKEEIDVFPGAALANELSVNVVDLCPVGALLEKDFLFSQRVWFLKRTPSIDGLTASGDNIYVEHNDGQVHRFKPRTNMGVNKWWISDEIRYSWKHVHDEKRLTTPMRRQFGVQVPTDWPRGLSDAVETIKRCVSAGKRLLVMVSPMLSCEDAFGLVHAARAIDSKAVVCMGPVPTSGQDKTFPANRPDGYRIYAEKAPNARGVRRVLQAVAREALTYEQGLARLRSGDVGAALITGNYPTDWVTSDLAKATDGKCLVLLDTLASRLSEKADVVLPSCTWVEKAGTFQNARDLLQAFEQAIPTVGDSRPEGQIGLDLLTLASPAQATRLATAPAVFTASVQGVRPATSLPGVATDPNDNVATPVEEGGAMPQDQVQVLRSVFNAAQLRQHMAAQHPELSAFATEVAVPAEEVVVESDMAMVEL
jgi:NADH-quinone oxidoreductase subunit G